MTEARREGSGAGEEDMSVRIVDWGIFTSCNGLFALGYEIMNFPTDRVRNFEKFKTDSMDLPYDYSSIMHFGM